MSLDHNEPEFIDLETADLTDNGKPMAYKESTSYLCREYENDMVPLMVKTNILEIIDMLSKLEDSEDKSITYQTMGLLRNTIILHRKTLEKNPSIVKMANNALAGIELNYDRYTLHKMFHNIMEGKSIDNLHFRNVNETVSDVPPIPAEERISIENKLQYFRFTKQVKKKLKPFKQGEIVGAKDKENNWWLARVLYVYTTPEIPDYWYYIRFEGWGPKHDEWINSNRYRVQAFRPKKHFLKRS